MDGHRFDEISRALARPLGRRGVFRAIAGAVFGGTAVAAVAEDASAGCPACPPGQYPGSACRWMCLSTGRPPLNGTCGCRAGETDCGDGVCKDLSSDAANCGQCGAVCPDAEQLCRAGTCFCPPERPTFCPGAGCVDTLTDPANCGECGHACPGDACNNPVCNAGVCGLAANPDAIGAPCDDGNRCTTDDICQPAIEGASACAGTPMPCRVPGLCEDGVTCNPGTGACEATYSDQGTPCENPNPCLSGGVCNGSGVCTGGTPPDCSELTTQCAVGTCNPDTGGCIAQPTPGVSCENPSLCLNGGTCNSDGVCVGGTPAVCDVCQSCIGAACGNVPNGSNDPRCPTICCAGECCADPAATCDGPGGTCVVTPTCGPDGQPCGTGDEVCCSDVCTNTQTDANHCGACDTFCDVDEFCCQGDCDPLVCTRFILSSGTDPTRMIYVDDDLRIDLIHGGDTDTILDDDDGVISELDPIEFTANQGDQLRVRAYDSGASQVLWPLYLHCASSSCFLPQFLTEGYTDNSGEADPGKFFDETFTIDVQRAP